MLEQHPPSAQTSLRTLQQASAAPMACASSGLIGPECTPSRFNGTHISRVTFCRYHKQPSKDELSMSLNATQMRVKYDRHIQNSGPVNRPADIVAN